MHMGNLTMALALSLVLGATLPSRASVAEPPWRWDRSFGVEAHSLQLQAAAVHPATGTLYLAGAFAKSGAIALGNSVLGIWVWAVSNTGERLWERRFPIGESTPWGPYSHIDAMAAWGNDTLLMVVRHQGSEQTLLTLDHRGEPKLILPLPGRRRILSIHADADRALLLGVENRSAAMIELTQKGELRAIEPQDRGKDEIFRGAVRLGQAYLLLEEGGERRQFSLADGEIHLNLFDKELNKRRELSLDGRQGDIAALGEGFAVVFDRAQHAEQDVVVRAFDAQLGTHWERSVFKSKFGLGGFRVASAGRGLVLAGESGKQLRVYALHADGRPAWEQAESSGPIIHAPLLASGGGAVYVAATELKERAIGEFQNRVRVIRISTGWDQSTGRP